MCEEKKITLEIPKHLLIKFKKLRYKNNYYLVPDLTEKYLEARYGPKWQTPNQSYVFHQDDRSISKSKNEND